MSQFDETDPLAVAYGLACNFHQALDLLSKDRPELKRHVQTANEITLSIGNLWSDIAD